MRGGVVVALLAGALAAGLALGAALYLALAPRIIMDRAMAGLSQDGAALNRMMAAPPITPETRRIVRPSPDLAYAGCVFDLSAGPVAVTTGAYDGYASLSFYAADTDNFHTVSADALRDGATVVLSRTGGAGTVRSPSGRGVALVRRLAPGGLAVPISDRCGPAQR